MSEFTKEELESIMDAFHYAKDSPRRTKYDDEPDLINKIQSMIDSYCDHQWAPTISTYEGENNLYICSKCQGERRM